MMKPELLSTSFSRGVIPTQNKAIDRILSDSMVLRVLRYLPQENLQSTAATCKSWNVLSITKAKNEEISLIENFKQFLVDKLSDKLNANQIEMLLSVFNDRQICDSINLMQVKSSNLDLREKILNILKELNEDYLISLRQLFKDEKKPKSFEKIMDLAIIYNHIDVANRIEDEMEKENKLYWICEELAYICPAKAIEVAGILTEQNREAAFHYIFSAQKDLGNVYKAAEVVNRITDKAKKQFGLQWIVNELERRGQFAEALNIVNSVTHSSYSEMGEMVSALYSRDFLKD